MIGSIDTFKACCGDTVYFLNPDAGYEPDQECARRYLELGFGYIIRRIKRGRYETQIWLKDIPVSFNSVMFKC